MSKAERLHGTAANLQAELRMTRVCLLRVQMLLDQYDAVCTSIQDAIVQCEHPVAQTSGASTPSATLANQFFLQQSGIKTQVRRLLNQAGLQIEQCSTALIALQAEVQRQVRPKATAHRRAPRTKDNADSAWTEEMP
ncbi:MAG: hypothetical protein JWO42_1880 [Chloroflexi bacterium]|nr:hypothetical protein [Chloroflexota bacterium]